jgi:broad specificity phosphatase PhoE
VSAIFLVRHGQASFGSADYDQLSERGADQARLAGRALAARGVAPARIVAGSLRRHRQTAEQALAAAGWPPDVVIDPGWNEFDHLKLVQAVALEPSTDPRAFQRQLDLALARWTAGGRDDEYGESFDCFRTRVEQALAAVDASLRSGETAVVFTSGGPIAWIAARLTGGGAASWPTFNRVSVNAAVSKVVSGRSGLSLVSFNEHAHLEPGSTTFR